MSRMKQKLEAMLGGGVQLFFIPVNLGFYPLSLKVPRLLSLKVLPFEFF